MLTHLQHFKQLDYLAIVCPQITDANTSHIAGLTNLDTLLFSKSAIGDATLPTSTLVVVAGLASPDMLIEIEAWAARG